jgi:cytidyltransferase-like protein
LFVIKLSKKGKKMQAVGIICEYNPLHAGHAYLLKRARERGDTVICLMSGNFVQRGEAAVLPPHVRAEMALAAGADLVLELPFPYACGSARYFATAGVRALAGVRCDVLAFGSETADKEALLRGAKRLNAAEFSADLDTRTPETGDAAAHFAALGDTPAANDILALEYTRAILEEGLPMEICPILREGASYHEAELGVGYPSATALRKKLADGVEITPYLPPVVGDIWQKALKAYGGTADTARLGTALLARLRAGALPDGIADCGGGLLAHLAKAARRATTYEELCLEASTKRYTNGRLRRAMLYLLAGVTREDLLSPPAYLRVLGANERGRAYLAETRKTRTVPVITKNAELDLGDARVLRQHTLEDISHALYALCMAQLTLPAALASKPPVML